MEIMRCEALTKTFASGENAVHAVKDVTLSFEKGEFVAVTGPSGSGKSTLLHMLGALEYPTSGKVYFQGATCPATTTTSFRSCAAAGSGSCSRPTTW